MDGNRRWAKERDLPSHKGHEAGAQKLLDFAEWARAAGVEEMVVYAFSSENWKRSPEEVEFLMGLLDRFFVEHLARFESRGLRIRFIGDLERLGARTLETMRNAEERTKDGTNGTLVLAISYGGRSEILTAVNTLLDAGACNIDEEAFASALWTKGLRDPDLIIRTGGDQRLSNFLPWQSVYSELHFTDTKWPDFSEEEFASILADFAQRERRHGK